MLKVSPEQIALVPIDVPYQMLFPQRYSCHSIVVSSDIVAPLFKLGRRVGENGVQLFRSGTYFRSIIDEAIAMAATGTRVDAEGICATIVSLLKEFGGERIGKAPSPSQRRIKFVTRAKSMIESNLGQPDLNVASLASSLGISTRQLQRAFAEEGVSPSDYIRGLRLDRAARMLADHGPGSLSITRIAYDCGFGSSSQFARDFKSRYENSPRDYRARLDLR